jgi:hypothetical protein
MIKNKKINFIMSKTFFISIILTGLLLFSSSQCNDDKGGGSAKYNLEGLSAEINTSDSLIQAANLSTFKSGVVEALKNSIKDININKNQITVDNTVITLPDNSPIANNLDNLEIRDGKAKIRIRPLDSASPLSGSRDVDVFLSKDPAPAAAFDLVGLADRLDVEGVLANKNNFQAKLEEALRGLNAVITPDNVEITKENDQALEANDITLGTAIRIKIKAKSDKPVENEKIIAVTFKEV